MPTRVGSTRIRSVSRCRRWTSGMVASATMEQRATVQAHQTYPAEGMTMAPPFPSQDNGRQGETNMDHHHPLSKFRRLVCGLAVAPLAALLAGCTESNHDRHRSDD